MTMYIILGIFGLITFYNTYQIVELTKKLQNQREVDKLTQAMITEHHKRIQKLEKEV